MERMIGIPSYTRTLNARKWDETIDGRCFIKGIDNEDFDYECFQSGRHWSYQSRCVPSCVDLGASGSVRRWNMESNSMVGLSRPGGVYMGKVT